MMPFREERAPVWAIWLLIAFSATLAMLWALGVAHAPLVLVPLVLIWIALVVFAVQATRSITRLWAQLDQKEEAHTATLTEVDQLQTQNTMLDIIARSVDVPLAFQALATRVARLVPCDRVG